MSSWHKYTALVILLLTLVYLLVGYKGEMKYLLSTQDQEAYKKFTNAEYKEAAKEFEDTMYKGLSYYRAGEFEKAQMVLSALSSKEGRYNYANALFMGGKYDKAIESYMLALSIDPDFKEAKENLELAKKRKYEINKHRDNDEGTGGKLAADETVFDNINNHGQKIEDEGPRESETAPTQWLERLQTSPKMFLKNKFSYQYQMQRGSDAP
jgi:Ca-activated chloride channel family protein